MSTRNPILTLRLLNETMALPTTERMDRLVKAKDLLRQYPRACSREAIDIELFHNDQIRYSGIQIDQNEKTMEWTAIGTPSVKALALWYQLSQLESRIDSSHVIESTEFYTPTFLETPKRYRISNWVISKNISREISKYRRHADKQKQRLEKYLFGNIMTFLNHIGFTYDKEQFFLKTKILNHQKQQYQSKVFHQQNKPTYEVEFSLNFQLPRTLRLGQSTALGYGKVRTIV